MGNGVIKVRKPNKGQLGIVCFYIFWLLLMVGKGIGYTATDEKFVIMAWAAIPFAFFKLLSTAWQGRDLIACIVLNALGIAVYIATKSATVLLTTVMLTCIYDINIHTMLKITFWLRLIMFIVVFSLALAGITDKQEILRYELGTTETRYAMGYGQPNSTQYTLFFIVALAVLVYRDRLKLWHYIIFSAMNIYVYTFTKSRAGVAIIFVLLLCSWIITVTNIPMLRKIIAYIAKRSYIAVFFMSILLCIAYLKLPFMRGFGTFSSRFLTATNVMTTEHLTLFGLENIKSDLGYINMIYSDGIIVALLFLIGTVAALGLCQRNNWLYEMVVFMCYAIYMFTEAYTDSILMNVSMIFMSMVLYRQDRQFLVDDYNAAMWKEKENAK